VTYVDHGGPDNIVWYGIQLLICGILLYTLAEKLTLDVDNVHSQGTKVVMKLADDLPAVGRCCVTDTFLQLPIIVWSSAEQ